MLTALVIGLTAAELPGQQPNAETNFPAAETETADGQAAQQAPAEQDAAPAAEAPAGPETDPLVLSLLESNPETPAELVRAAHFLLLRDRPALARGYLEKLNVAQLDQATLAALGRELGPGPVVRLALTPELAPYGQQLADAVGAALEAQAAAPERLREILDWLGDPTLDAQRRAVNRLREMGPRAVGPLIAILADPQQAARHPRVRAALAAMGSQAVPPLIGALEGAGPELQAQVIRVLGWIGSTEAAPFLLAPAVSPQRDQAVQQEAQRALVRMLGSQATPAEGARLLERETRDWFQREQRLEADINGQVVLWRWNAELGQSVPVSYPPDTAAAIVAAQLARDLAELDLGPETQPLVLAASLEAAALEAGRDQPLPTGPGTAHDLARQAGPVAVNRALAFALRSGHPAAGTAAARILAEIGSPALLAGQHGEPAPLVRAIHAGDRRLQQAAAEAVLRLAGDEPFAGASGLAQSVTFLATSRGLPRAVVGHPNAANARNIAGRLSALGYLPVIATTGRELFQAATASADVELVLVHQALTRPGAEEVIRELRRDWRTATVPVGLMELPSVEPRVMDRFADDSYSLAFATPADAAIMRTTVERLLEKAGQGIVPRELRARQGAWAVEALAELVETHREWLDVPRVESVLTDALRTPALAPQAAAALAALGTPAAQRALVNAASNALRPSEVREAAAGAFAKSVEQYGAMLTSEELLRQYDRYQLAASADPAHRAILGTILGALEANRQPGSVSTR